MNFKLTNGFVLSFDKWRAGERAFLLGQGYMPAQQFHVLKNPAHEDDPWYYVDEVSYPFYTPEYTFDEGSFMRPVYQQSIDIHHESPMMGQITTLRDKYDLSMKVERYVSDEMGIPSDDQKYIRS